MVKRMIKTTSEKKNLVVLNAKGRDEWKRLARKGIIKNLKVKRVNNKDFGLHWKLSFTRKKQTVVRVR